MGKILPILLAFIGLGGGAGAGFMLRPEPEIVEINPCGELESSSHAANAPHSESAHDAEENLNRDFVKMNNQFVIPVVGQGQVRSLVALSLSLEIAAGSSEEFYQKEPKLRDAFLQVLFDHANLGGFDGVFTDSVKLSSLRMGLEEVATKIMGSAVYDVLVTDIVRQDM
ncbi:flagellar basal body-associated FliL family protein [Aliiroseovarius sp. KMU-50]|uniref:Flagellar protein FliL n=1 Tax=Aliiroseovarius salicola TaxID=3009082 RepID=A0ABT4W3M8_9RHOB|nr:flagellar basal body-associated FliL family protein [Aliiroseovarius sp. KMU-50]MDA5095091.1 flagellar basal body-associated FliL family protein [Aliiroseovarius sp. KMU-50]